MFQAFQHQHRSGNSLIQIPYSEIAILNGPEREDPVLDEEIVAETNRPLITRLTNILPTAGTIYYGEEVLNVSSGKLV